MSWLILIILQQVKSKTIHWTNPKISASTWTHRALDQHAYRCFGGGITGEITRSHSNEQSLKVANKQHINNTEAKHVHWTGTRRPLANHSTAYKSCQTSQPISERSRDAKSKSHSHWLTNWKWWNTQRQRMRCNVGEEVMVRTCSQEIRQLNGYGDMNWVVNVPKCR